MPSTRARRLLAAGIGLAVLAVVAYLVAGSRDAASEAWVGIPDAAFDMSRDLLLAGLILLTLLVIVAIVVAVATREKGARFRPRDTSVVGLIGVAVLVFFVWFLINNAGRLELELEAPQEAAEALAELGGDEEIALPEADGPGGVIFWFALLAAGVGAWALNEWRRSRQARAGLPKTVRDEVRRGRRLVLVGLLDDAIARLRDHPDPREATIAAWARLETALEAMGIPRRRSDTPSTYLRRVLEEVEASAPAVEGLTRAYERAMFSPHRIDRATQLESVDALVAVRDELRVLDRVEEAVRA